MDPEITLFSILNVPEYWYTPESRVKVRYQMKNVRLGKALNMNILELPELRQSIHGQELNHLS